MKTKTKALSWLLSLAMVLSLVPGMSLTALAESAPIESNPIMFYGRAFSPDFKMSFSNYEYDSYSEEYYQTPLENFVDWYVIDFQQGANDYDKGTVTLFAERPQELVAFDEYGSQAYSTSGIKKLLDGYVDPDPQDMDTINFFAQFADAIIDTDTDGDNTGDSKLYLLSYEDLMNMQNSYPQLFEFLKFQPSYDDAKDLALTRYNYYEYVWWLRKQSEFYYYDSQAGNFANPTHAFPVGEENGATIFDTHQIGPADQLGIRPAMKIDLNKISYRQNGDNGGVFYIVPVTAIEINKTEEQTISVGETVAFQSRLTGYDFGGGMEAPSDTTVKWSVVGENPGNVKLYYDQKCTNEVGTDAIPHNVQVYAEGESEGSVKVRVTSNADSTKYAECSVKVEAATRSVTLTGGENATISGGDATQTGLTGEMTAVTYTADKGYYFEDFADVTNNGITATKISDTVVTVSGTPTADAAITIPDAVAKSAYSPYEMNSDKPVKLNGIDWYIINDESTATDAGTVTLLAKDALGSSNFNPKGGGNAYSGSAIQKYLDEMADSGLLSDIYDAIVPVDLADVNVTDARLYLLSADEANSLDSSVRMCKWGNQNDGWKNIWFTRSPGYENAAMCISSGSLASNTDVLNVCGVRPAFCLDLSMVNFNSETREFTLKPSDSGYYVMISGGGFAAVSPSEGTMQTGLTGAMTTVTYTANQNYYFEPFEDITKNGITVKRKSETEITVSGTPTANTRIKIPDTVTMFPAYLDTPDKTVKFNGIEWYVIADNSTVLDDGTLTLLAKYPMKSSQFDPKGASNKYSTSAVKEELEKMALSFDAPTLKTYGQTGEGISPEATVSSDSFVNVLDAIVPTDLEDVGVTDAKLYLLNVSEAMALNADIRKCTWANGSSLNFWYLRSPNPLQKQMVKVVVAGTGNEFVQYSNSSLGIRPALRLDLSKVEFDPETNTFEHIENAKIGEIKYYKATKSGDIYTKTGDALNEAPTNAGDYVAEVTVTIGEDYIDTASVGYTIAKAEPLCNPPTALTATYGQTLGDVPLTNQEGNTPGEWTWYLGNNKSVGDVGSNSFYAVFNPVDTENYKTGKLKELTITVSKADPTVTAPSEKTLTYSGPAQELITAGATDAGTMQYKLGEDGTYSENIPTATNAGDYTVYYKVICDANHNDSAEGSVNVTIAKRSVTLTSATDSKEYDGTPLTNDEVTVSGDGFANGEGAQYNVTGTRTLVGVSENEFNYELNNNTLADNYNIQKNNGTLTVTNRNAKYEITLKANSGEYTYDGTEKTVSGVEKTEFDVEGNTYTVSGMTAEVKGANAGEYAVNVTGTPVIKDAGGNEVSEQFAVTVESGKLTIAKAAVTVAELPTASELRSGSALSSSTISGGKVLFGETEVPGKFAWADGTIMPTVDDSGKTEYDVIFTPDSENFDVATAKITLTVKKRSSGGGGGGGSSVNTGAKATEAPKATDAPSATAAPAATATPEATAAPAATAAPEGDKWFKDVPEGLWYYAPIKAAFDNGRMSGMSEDFFEPEIDITRGMFAYAIYRREGLPETGAENKFEDVKADTYYEAAIAWATEASIVSGYDDTHYGPDDPITREQMAAILYRYAQFKKYDVSVGEDTNILDFTDASDISEYAIPAIQWAVGDKIISGFDDMTMRPQNNATRAQMAVILNGIADMF